MQQSFRYRLMVLCLCFQVTLMAQESILAAWKSDVRLGDEKLRSGLYSDALVYYDRARIKTKNSVSLLEKTAHCYYQLKLYPEAI